MSYVRPRTGECPPYYFTYIDQVPDVDIIELLRSQIATTTDYLTALPPELGTYRYEDGKWSLSEVVGHMVDTERIFAYRGLRIARGDKTPMPGFEQDDYVASTDFTRRSVHSLAQELAAVRSTTIPLFENLSVEEIARSGTASGYPFTARTIPYIIAGHELHHLSVIKERYV